MDKTKLPIGTIIQTCNEYVETGILGMIVSKFEFYGSRGSSGYKVKALKDGRRHIVYVQNLEIVKFTDLERVLYNINESLTV